MIHAQLASARDEISDLLGDRRFATPWYFPELKPICVGRYSRDLVGVSRFYKWRDPPVVVDFEPSPLEGKFFSEEKRKWCHSQHLVYVPIFLTETLSGDQFASLVRKETEAMHTGWQRAQEDAFLAEANGFLPDALPFETAMTRHEFTVWLDQRAYAILDAEVAAGRKLQGFTRPSRLKKIKRELIARIRHGRAYGGLGHLVGAGESSHAARG